MIDFLSLLWTVFQGWGVANWMISIACVLAACSYLLMKEYGRIYIAHLLHRRNRLSLCSILFYFCVFLALFQTGLFMRMPFVFRILTSILYAGYIAAVLCSVQGPILLSRRYLNKYRRWLSRGFVHEHRDFLSKMPWYFLDQSEIISYQQLKGKYLYELGNLRLAYETLSDIDQALLYPEEIADLTVNLVYMTLELGNFPKAEQLAEVVKAADLPTYGFLKSYLAELQGNSDAAWRYACDGENAIRPRQANAHILTSLYTQLGRLSFFRDNTTEGFRYYHLALQQAKRCGDIRLLHPVYQN